MANRFQLYKLAFRALSAVKNYAVPNVTNRGPQARGCRQYWKNGIFLGNTEFRRYVSTAEPSESSVPQENYEGEDKSDVLQILSTLKMKMSSLGPLQISDIRTGIEKIEKQCAELSDDEFLLLLRLTINTVENEYRNCAHVVDKVWNLCANKEGKRLTLQHLELYFQLCLLAEVPIGSETMLSLVQDHNIDISRELLELMMLILGRQGRLEDTTDMLAFMKQRDIPITEVTFSGLILAHGFSRDVDGIHSVTDTMNSVQMGFTTVTYHALMTAYAVSGNFPKVKNVVRQMNRANVACSPNQLKSLLLDLVKSNEAGENFENMEFIISLMKEKDGIMDFSMIALRLIHHGHVPEIIRLLSLHPLIIENREFYTNGRIYIQEMVRSIKDADLLIDMCRQLEQDEINKYAVLVALEIALSEHREELAWALLKAAKDDGRPLRQHYFWPLLNGTESRKTSKLMEYVQNMVELGIPPDLETMSDFIIPGLTMKEPESMEHMLKDTGLKVSQIATPVLLVLVKNRMIDKALQYAKTLKVEVSLRDVTSTLARAWTTSPQSVLSLLALLITKSKENKTSNELEADWGGQFLLDITASRSGLNKHQILPLFKELKKHNIRVSENSADYLVARANQSIQMELKDNIQMLLDSTLGHPPKEQDYNFMPHPNEMNVEELEGHLIELQRKGFNTRGVIRKLIVLHAAQNNRERVLSLVEKLKETGDTLSPGMLASILGTYVTIKSMDAALTVYKSLKENHPSFNLDGYKVIDFCTALLGNGQIETAIKILEEGLVLEGNNNFVQKQVRRNCRELLMAAAGKCDYEATKKIYDILKKKNIIKVDNLMLGPLIKCHLNIGDLDGAVEEIKSISREFALIPMRIEVLIHLLRNAGDAGSNMDSSQESLESSNKLLEEMVNVIAESHGSTSAWHDLFFACVEAGYPSQAAQVLKSIGKRINMTQIQRQCQRYAKTSREEPLLHILTASRAAPNLNRCLIFESLLNLYYVQNDGSKGLSLWTQMQDDDVSPSKAFLGTLASLLASNDIDIPFQVPQLV